MICLARRALPPGYGIAGMSRIVITGLTGGKGAIDVQSEHHGVEAVPSLARMSRFRIPKPAYLGSSQLWAQAHQQCLTSARIQRCFARRQSRSLGQYRSVLVPVRQAKMHAPMRKEN